MSLTGGLGPCVPGYKLRESFVRELGQRILGPGEGIGPLGLIFEFGHEKPGNCVSLLRGAAMAESDLLQGHRDGKEAKKILQARRPCHCL